MNERAKDALHRWLPKLAILSVLVFLFSLPVFRVLRASEIPRC